MAILDLDHVSILAADPQAVADFYQRFLGFAEVSRREVPGMLILDLVKGRDHVEVIQPTDGREVRAGGLKHVAFRSDDVRADFARFREEGAQMLHEEVQRSTMCDYFFMRSPGGEWVEILQHHQEVDDRG